MKVEGLFRNSQATLALGAGAVVFSEGDQGHEMFGIVSGGVELRHGDRVVVTLGPDDVFGEMALIDKSPRSLTAVTMEDTTLAVIDQRMFLFLVQETPMFALSVMSSMADQLRAASHGG
jgi:CRP-like cAMP-binding protein